MDLTDFSTTTSDYTESSLETDGSYDFPEDMTPTKVEPHYVLVDFIPNHTKEQLAHWDRKRECVRTRKIVDYTKKLQIASIEVKNAKNGGMSESLAKWEPRFAKYERKLEKYYRWVSHL